MDELGNFVTDTIGTIGEESDKAAEKVTELN